jgi:hypothetical protein
MCDYIFPSFPFSGEIKKRHERGNNIYGKKNQGKDEQKREHDMTVEKEKKKNKRKEEDWLQRKRQKSRLSCRRFMS